MDYFIQLLIILVLVCLMIHIFYNSHIDIAYKHTIIQHSFNKNKYIIYEIKNVLNKEECDIIMQISKNRLVRSSVISNNPISDIRTSKNTFLHKSNEKLPINDILEKIDNLTVKISGKPIENQEPLQVVKYDKDQQYKSHYDCCVPHESELCIEDAKKFGYRHSTFLLYLNDVEHGGETEFPLLKYKFKPKMGCGIFFFNLVKDESKFHVLSKHAGLPPLQDEKWVCNKWVRTKRYN